MSTRKITAIRSRPVTLQAAVDAFLSSPRCENANTCRAYATVLDKVAAQLDPACELADVDDSEISQALHELWDDAAPRRGTATAPRSAPGFPGVRPQNAGRRRRSRPTASAAPSTPTTRMICPSERSTASSLAATSRCARRRCGGCCMRPPRAPRRSSRSTSSSSTSPTAEHPSAPKAARPNGCTGAPAPPTSFHDSSGFPTARVAPADRCSSPTESQRPLVSHRPAISARTPAGPGSATTAPVSSCTATPAGDCTSSGTPPPPTSARRRSRLQLIMAKTRHRSPRTAMRYVHPGGAAVAEVTELLDPPRRTG